MATSYKLVMLFGDADGGTINMSCKYAKASPMGSKVKTVMDTIIANGSIFKRVPTTKKDAYVIATDQTSIDIT